VTIQLPLYNEMYVADRLIAAVCAIDYPRELLEIQVLDDSTDETRGVADLAVRRFAAQGYDIKYIHRTHRVGYKAGALEEGLKVARGEFVAIFDADFIPTADFLTRLMPHFGDPGIGMVQARWGHINQDYSLLTKIQSILLDGHFVLEHGGRNRARRFFNFNGTAGVWRRTAIDDAGGWQHDTLTEDLDLSYRAQLAGWKFVYREDVVSPAELPEEVSAFRAQQFRWAKGTVQTSRKLLKRVMSAPELSIAQRIEAFFHLTPHFAYPLMVLLSVLLLPALILMPATDTRTMLLLDLPLCIGTTGSLGAFYMLAEAAQGRARLSAIARLPALIALGAGLAPHLTRAVMEGLDSMAGEFVRTPKKGLREGRYRARTSLPAVEVGLALLSLASVVASIETKHWFATPFAMLFTFGYSYVALLVGSEQALRRREARQLEAAQGEGALGTLVAGPGDSELAA
jgi:glycosyltransferase involved in cell wall biosynthesis